MAGGPPLQRAPRRAPELWRYHGHVRGCLVCTLATDRPEPRALRNLCPEGRELWAAARRATGARWRDNLPPDPTPLLRLLNEPD